MNRAIELAKAASTIVAGLMAVLSLVGWVNQAILEHLDKTFATRSDMLRIELKIDKMSSHVEELDKRYFHDTRPSGRRN